MTNIQQCLRAVMAARGSANWEVGWEARRGGASWAKTSQAGSAEGPGHCQPVGVSLLKRVGDRGQPNRCPSAAVQVRRLHIPKSPLLLSPLSPRAQAAVTKLVQSCNATEEHIHNHKKKLTGWKEVAHAHSRLRWNELDYQLSLPYPNASP